MWLKRYMELCGIYTKDEVPRQRDYTRIHLLMQSTRICNFRVRACVIVVVLKSKIQILVRITNICASPNPKIA